MGCIETLHQVLKTQGRQMKACCELNTAYTMVYLKMPEHSIVFHLATTPSTYRNPGKDLGFYGSVAVLGKE